MISVPKVNINEVKDFYNKVNDVWANTPWYKYSKEQIQKHINKLNISLDKLILNAGSGGNSYGIVSNNLIHVDIAGDKLKNISNSVVASIEKLPFDDNTFDIIICVGSVLNYCDCIGGISELLRVLKYNGILLLEYESSWGFEYKFNKVYKKDASLICLTYIEQNHKQWLYSPRYVNKAITMCGGKILYQTGFHLSSGIIANFTDNDTICVKFNKFDGILGRLPYINKHYSNNVLKITK